MAQDLPADSTTAEDLHSTMTMPTQEGKHPWKAVGQVVATNGIIHCLGRYVMHEPFSKTNMRTIRHNFRSGFAWDDDNFYVNYAGHAYQGSLYFNAARSNGLTFLESVPYTLLGSLTWEFFGENEQPSINDVITTTFSGSFLGEVTHRVSKQLIDERERGGRRFVREAAAALINPLEGFHRVVSGRAWKVRRGIVDPNDQTTKLPNDENKLCISIGDRYVASADNFSHGTHQPFVALSMEYGEAADGERHTTLYDYFVIDSELAYGKKQHLLSNLTLTGRLCSTPIPTKGNYVGELGLYQYFLYEDTRLPGDNPRGPFPFGEMVSMGPGLTIASAQKAPRFKLEQRVYVRGIMLGAIESDYYEYYNRHYNMGSGYGASSQSKISWKSLGGLQLKAYYMHLYSWRGYEPRNLSDLAFDDNYLNVLGDRSDARLLALSLQLHSRLSQQMALAFGTSYYSRHTHYKYHASHHAESYELWAGIQWHF